MPDILRLLTRNLVHPTRHDRRRKMALGVLLAVAVLCPSMVAAQEARAGQAGTQDSVPVVQPTLERLFWADSLRLWAPFFSRGDRISVSSDGRWIALAAFGGEGRVNLWSASLGSGRTFRLTDGPHVDQDPVWFPDGRAIAFSSSRPDAPQGDHLYLMRMSVSPETGAPVGPPVRLSLDPATEFGISPDGRWIAYATAADSGGESLKVMPATGGNARTVASIGGVILAPRWGPDARYLYFLGPDDPAEDWSVMRVPEGGGDPERVSTWEVPPWIHLGPEARFLLRKLPSGEHEPALYEIASTEGPPRVRFRLPKEYMLIGFDGRPDRILAIRQDIVNPLRIVPVFGGPVRQLNEKWGYDVPLGWTPDGGNILIQTELNGEKIFMFAPVGGGTMRQVAIPESIEPGTWPILSGDGQHVLFMTHGDGTGTGDDGSNTLWMYDIARDSAQIVDEGVPDFQRSPGFGLEGAGVGSTPFRSGEGFGYWVTRDGSHEVRLLHPSGSTELLWSFGADTDAPPPFAIHGTRIAFTQCHPQSRECSLFLGDAASGGARRVFSRAMHLSWLNRPTWSRDGRRLAVPASLPGSDDLDILLFEMGESGDVVAEPRLLQMDGGPPIWWSLQWLPDGEHFVVCGMGTDGLLDTEIWLVSTDPTAAPVAITADLQESVWNFVLSPDGRYVAIESDLPRGASIWRIDLGTEPTGAEP